MKDGMNLSGDATKRCRAVSATWALGLVLGMTGCDAKDSGKPNTELTVPDIPPGGFQADSKDLGDKAGKRR